MGRAAVLLAVPAVVLATTSLPAQPALAAGPTCPRAPAGLVTATSSVRVWRSGARLLGCATGHAPRLLVSPGLVPAATADDVIPASLTAPPAVDVDGTRVAYGYFDEFAAGAIVQDLARPVPEIADPHVIYSDVTSISAPGAAAVGRVVIGPGDRLAAVVCPRAGHSHAASCLGPGHLDEIDVAQPGFGGRVVAVARSRGIAPRSLRRKGDRLVWLEAGRRRSASFRRPRPLPRPCATAGLTRRRHGRVRVLQQALPGVAARHAPLEACRVPRGRIRELWLHDRLAPGEAIAGDWIASTGYIDTSCYAHTHSRTGVSVTSVTGSPPAIWDIGGDLNATNVAVRRVVVGADGLAAIVVGLRPRSCGGLEPSRSVVNVVGVLDGRTATHQILARGDIPASTLQLNGRRVSWTHAGRPHAAEIPRR